MSSRKFDHWGERTTPSSDPNELGDERSWGLVDATNDALDSLHTAYARAELLCSLESRGRLGLINVRDELRDLSNAIADALDAVSRLLPHHQQSRVDPRVILIIDEDREFGRTFRRHLDLAGFKAFHEAKPSQAAQAFALLRPAVVFIELEMSERFGHLVAAELRALSSAVVIVMMTPVLTDDQILLSGTAADFVAEKGVGYSALVSLAGGDMPPSRVVRPDWVFTDEHARRRNAQRALKDAGSLQDAAMQLQLDPRTVKRLIDDAG